MTPEYFAKDNYGTMPLIQSEEQLDRPFISINDINETLIKQIIWIRGCVQATCKRGKQCLFVIRHQSETVQAFICDNEYVSKLMVQFVTNIPKESIIDVEGEVILSPTTQSCTQKNIALQVKKVFVVSTAIPPLLNRKGIQFPYNNICVRLDNRVIDLRTPTNQAIFRLEAGVCNLFRDILDAKGFIEIHTPKITSVASISHWDVFHINYFKTNAYLSQSPQFYKQMAIAGDFEKIYTVGTVFRAVGGNTHQHLTEFISLGLEMSFSYHYHEVLDIIGDLFIQIFKSLAERFGDEIEIINKQFPCEPFQYSDPPLRLDYKDSLALLAETGVQVGLEDGLTVENERNLGRIIKIKYRTDFYILDKYPLVVRPFYTMPDPENPKLSNSYAIFMRGRTVLSGAQHIHDIELLLERAKHHRIDMDHIKPYINAFRYGCPPHAGGEFGLERLLMLYLSLDNIRRTSLFPRDPHRLTP